MNRTEFLARTLESVLQQDPGPDAMEIQVVDNGSRTDDAAALVHRIGKGRVSLRRQPVTLPLHDNWNSCIAGAGGHWVHLLHDDDAVLPDFYTSYESLINRTPGVTLVTAPSILINEKDEPLGVDPPIVARDGPVLDFARRIAISNPLKTPSVVIARSAYEEVGGFSSELSHTADWEMFFRAGTSGVVAASTEPRSLYRIHSGSDTSSLVREARNIEEIVKVIDICFARLDAEDQRALRPTKYLWAAAVAYGCAAHLAEEGDWSASLRQAQWALRLKPRPRFALAWLSARLHTALARRNR